MTSIRPMVPEDRVAVETIYREGIATGHATFEVEGLGHHEGRLHRQEMFLSTVAEA